MAGSNIGALLYVSTALPATEDTAGYAALTWVLVSDILTIGEMKETTEDIAKTHLSDGRTRHFAGAVDGGVLSVTMENTPADAGQVIINAAMGSDVNKSIKLVDAAGVLYNFQGKFVNKAFVERSSGTTDDVSFDIWRNSKTV